MARAKSTEKEILRRYAQVIEILGNSKDLADRVLATALADRFSLQRPPPMRPEVRTERPTPLPIKGHEPGVPGVANGNDKLSRAAQ